MTINKQSGGSELTIILEGRLDTTTAPQLDTELKSCLSNVKKLTMDFTKLSYISSAGLRVLLSTQKTMNRQGTMKVIGVNDTIMEVFELTGFIDILDVETL